MEQSYLASLSKLNERNELIEARLLELELQNEQLADQNRTLAECLAIEIIARKHLIEALKRSLFLLPANKFE